MMQNTTTISGILCVIIMSLSGCVSQTVTQDKENSKTVQTPPEHALQYKNAAHLLDATNFEYFYEDGSGLNISFYEGKLKYEWIVGPRKGNNSKDISYQSRKIGDDLYMVNWHEKNKPDFTSLIIDLKNKALYSSAILRYGTDIEMIHFKEATIKNVKRLTK